MKIIYLISFICIGVAQTAVTGSLAGAEKPNFVVIFTDDQGYGDLSCF